MFAEPKLVAFCAARCLGIDFCNPRVLDATIGSVGHDHHVRRIFLGQWRVQLVCSGAPYPEKERWGWLLFSGIVGILTGVVVLVAPWVATIVLASFLWASVGFWAIFTGVLEISAAVRLRREIKGEIWLALSGLLSIILGAIVLWIFFTRPVESFVAAGWLLGFHAAVYGVTLLFLSWSLRKRAWGKSVPNQNLWI